MQETSISAAPPVRYDLVWDECALIDSRVEELLESGVASSETEAIELASLDAEFIEFEYEDFLERFGELLRAVSVDGNFLVEGLDMGWQRQSGSLKVAAWDAKAFIDQTFPSTSEWIFRGATDYERNVLRYRLFHHDAPCGESYEVRAISY